MNRKMVPDASPCCWLAFAGGSSQPFSHLNALKTTHLSDKVCPQPYILIWSWNDDDVASPEQLKLTAKVTCECLCCCFERHLLFPCPEAEQCESYLLSFPEYSELCQSTHKHLFSHIFSRHILGELEVKRGVKLAYLSYHYHITFVAVATLLATVYWQPFSSHSAPGNNDPSTHSIICRGSYSGNIGLPQATAIGKLPPWTPPNDPPFTPVHSPQNHQAGPSFLPCEQKVLKMGERHPTYTPPANV